MTKRNETRRLPRSTRKHLRERKAALRRELPSKDAERAIEQMERSAHGRHDRVLERHGRAES